LEFDRQLVLTENLVPESPSGRKQKNKFLRFIPEWITKYRNI